MAESIISVLPHEIIKEILLNLPPKSLLKFMCVSKSWLELISSAKFIKNHLKQTANDKEYSHHRIIFQDSAHNLRYVVSLPCLTKNEAPSYLTLVLPRKTPLFILGLTETVLWNPAINKSKKLPTLGAKLRNGFSYYLKYGFGYDETRDDYKVVVIQCIYADSGSCDTVVNIYSLKAYSWRTINKFQGNFLVNSLGKFVNGKLYWALSADVDTFNMCNIISLDLADETWRRLEIPDSYGKCSYPLALEVVGSHLSVLCLNYLEGTNSNVWISGGGRIFIKGVQKKLIT
uniref:F-Box protein, putative n=1 Tax=Solanum demissum TaxID=50514 RepID=Q6L3W3_SOLDE|nr:F-Box protein, putative [Solanum demissum]